MVAVFGGSVSAGHQLEYDAPPNTPSVVLRDRYTWGFQLVAWLNQNYPPEAGEHGLINLAHGGAGTVYAVTHQLVALKKQVVDLVITEFGVNDSGKSNMCESSHPSDGQVQAQPSATSSSVEAEPCLVAYTERFVRHFMELPDPPAMVYVEFAYYFIKPASENVHFQKHLRVCSHYDVPMWSLLDALKKGGEAFGFGKDWRSGSSQFWPRAHPNVEGHRLIAEYIIKNLQRVKVLGNSGKPLPLPPPISLEVATKVLHSPTTTVNFRVDLQSTGKDSGLEVVQVARDGDVTATDASATPWPQLREARGWVHVDEGRAKRGYGPTKFGLVSSTETCARAAECILVMDVKAGPTKQVQVGYLRSYENMGRATISIDGAVDGAMRVELDGQWADHSSQYNSVLLDIPEGTHTLRVERLEADDGVERGVNKFKILDILVY